MRRVTLVNASWHNYECVMAHTLMRPTHCNTYNTLQHTATHCNTLRRQTCMARAHQKSSHCNTHCNTYCNTHCNSLQHTLQHTAVHTATHCDARQTWLMLIKNHRIATYCNTLQHTLQHTATPDMQRSCLSKTITLQHTVTHTATRCNIHCNTLQHTLQRTLQHTATHTATHCNIHCNTLQHAPDMHGSCSSKSSGDECQSLRSSRNRTDTSTVTIDASGTLIKVAISTLDKLQVCCSVCFIVCCSVCCSVCLQCM